MKIKNIILGTVAVAMAAALTGCYERFNEPAPLHRWTRAEIEAEGLQIITIGELRQMFETNVGDPANVATYGKHYRVSGNYAIEGKVISNDAFGNFYRNLFIQDVGGDLDARRGIEIKIGLSSMHSAYPVGTTIFVICKDLALGNYRKNLSLGLPEEATSSYANKYIDVQSLIDHHVRRGPRTTMAVGDTLVINSGNIASFYTENSYGDKIFHTHLSGLLIRFEDAKCTWGTFGTDNNYPSFQNSNYENVFFTDLFAAWEAYDAGTGAQPANPRPANFYFQNRVPTWAFQEYRGTTRYYGSVRFTIGDCPVIIRTSGYSRFALDPVPVADAVVDMTGIVNLYTSGSGGYATNQLVINDSSDVAE